MLRLSRLFIVLLAFAACSGNVTPPAVPQPFAAQPDTPRTTGTYLYASDGPLSSIDVFASNAFSPGRSITDGVSAPVAVAVAPDGTVVVADALVDSNAMGAVEVYAPGANTPKARLGKSIFAPNGLAIDKNGVVYVANKGNDPAGNGWIAEYSSKLQFLRKVQIGIAATSQIAIGPDGYLYAVSQRNNSITAYKPGSIQVARTYTVSGFIAGMAFDKLGNFYVLGQTQFGGGVAEFAHGTTKAVRSWANGIEDPNAIAVDAAGYVYVANHQGGKYNAGGILCFAPGKSTASVTIPLSSGRAVSSIGIDPSNNVYISTFGMDYTKGYDTGIIDAYTQGLRIHKGTLTGKTLGGPDYDSLAFGPN